MRGHSAAYQNAFGVFCALDVTLSDVRARNLEGLLRDFSKPGLCIVLGAGASYGVVEISRKDFIAAVRELEAAHGAIERIPARFQELWQGEAVKWVAKLLLSMPIDSNRDAVLDEYDEVFSIPSSIPLATAQLGALANRLFTPTEVPPELKQVYNCFNNANGNIVTFNYDRVVGEESGFNIIAPHGQRSNVVGTLLDKMQKDAFRAGIHPPLGIHPPVPELENVVLRPAFDLMLAAWRAARCVVFIGYGFGSVADEFSFREFSRAIQPRTRVRVICPDPDNRDLVKQIESSLKNRARYERVLGHPFRWRPLTASILGVLRDIQASGAEYAAPYSPEVVARHDRWTPDSQRGIHVIGSKRESLQGPAGVHSLHSSFCLR